MKFTVLIFTAMLVAGCATRPVIHHVSYMSGSFGSIMDSTDHARANEVLEGGSENRPTSWENPISRRRFTVTPTRTFKLGAQDCRDYAAIYGGRSVSGSACRLNDGMWLSRVK